MPAWRQHIRPELVEVLVHGMASRLRHLHLHLVVDLDQSFERAQLVDAFKGTIEAFPVLGCRYRPGFWRDRWIPWEGDVADLVHVDAGVDDVDGATQRVMSRSLPHEERPPYGLSLLEHNQGSRLIVSVHHMVADGGGMKAIANVLGARLYGVEPRPPPSDERRLLTPLRSLRLVDVPLLLAELVREGVQPLSILRVGPLDSPPHEAGGEDVPRWRTVTVSGRKPGGFVDLCRRLEVTINDGLVAVAALLARRRSRRGPVAAAYTIDLRRYLPRPRSLVTNLHGASLVVLPRDELERPEAVLRAVSRRIGTQKRRLPGLAYAVLPALSLGWMPHGLMRWAGRLALGNVLAYLDRALAMTNIGALDEPLAPFGESVRAASIFGPFIAGLPLPVITATGFKGDLTLNLCSTRSELMAPFEADLVEVMGQMGGSDDREPHLSS